MDVARAADEPEAVGRRAAVLAHRHRRAEVDGHHAGPGGGERARIVARSARRADDRGAAVRRVDLGRPGLEHQQGQPGEALAEQGAVAAGQPVRDERVAQPGHGAHPPAALAGDRRVVDGDPAPVGDGRRRSAPVVAEGERDEPGPDAEPPKERSGANSLTWCTGHVVGDVDRRRRSGRPASPSGGRRACGRRGGAARSAAAGPGSGSRRRTRHVARSRPSPARPSASVTRAAGGPAAVEHEPVDPVVGEQAGAGALGPGQVRLGHALAPAVAGVGVRPGRSIQRGISSWRQPRPAAPRRSASLAGVWRAGHGLHRAAPARPRRRSRTSSSVVEVGDAVLVPPAVEDVLGRAAVEAAVDLGAAAGAAALGVGDRREAEGRRDAAGAVLAVHLLERERHDLALADQRPFLERRARRSRPRRAAPPSARRRRPSR